MIRNEFEAFDRQRHGRVYKFHVNISKLLYRIWGPKKSDIEEKLRQAKWDQAQYEAWFSKPTKSRDERTSS